MIIHFENEENELSNHLKFLHSYIYLKTLEILLQRKIFFLPSFAGIWSVGCNVLNENKSGNIYSCKNEAQQVGGSQFLPSTFARINKRSSE